jgi:hypothetical protein
MCVPLPPQPPHPIQKTETRQLDKWGYESFVEQTKAKSRDVRFAADKCIVFLIMGSYMLADGTKVKDVGVAHVVEDEEGLRLAGNTAVAMMYVD